METVERYIDKKEAWEMGKIRYKVEDRDRGEVGRERKRGEVKQVIL